MLDDNRVGRFLRARGYEHHQFGSWWVGTYHNPIADSNQPFGFSEFDMTYLRRTDADAGLPPAAGPAVIASGSTGTTANASGSRGRSRRSSGSGTGRPPGLRLRPHPRAARAGGVRAGRALPTRRGSDARGETQGYAEQVAYADAIIEELVTTLQAQRPATAGRS